MFQEIIKNLDWNKIIISIITLFGAGLFIGIKYNNRQTQKSGNHSNNYQANGNITIGNFHNDK